MIMSGIAVHWSEDMFTVSPVCTKQDGQLTMATEAYAGSVSSTANVSTFAHL